LSLTIIQSCYYMYQAQHILVLHFLSLKSSTTAVAPEWSLRSSSLPMPQNSSFLI
uniref:Uncharacterized protein n=1 Tax=Amphimedon queenslandica TaxID=400682 RepID=A0A1X7V564_AMPQE